MSKYILIDLEDTITIHKNKDRVKSVMIRWLENNGIINKNGCYHASIFILYPLILRPTFQILQLLFQQHILNL